MRTVIQYFAAGILLAGISSLSAQQSNAPGQAQPPARRAQGPGGPGGGGRMLEGPIANVMTEEQRASFAQAMQAQRASIRDLEVKLRDARRELMLAGVDGKFDEAAVRRQAMAVANLEAELTVARVRALSQVRPPLSPEQIERIRNATPAPGPATRPAQPARRRILSDGNRDENDLPPKQ